MGMSIPVFTHMPVIVASYKHVHDEPVLICRQLDCNILIRYTGSSKKMTQYVECDFTTMPYILG